MQQLPLLIEPEELSYILPTDTIRIVELSTEAFFDNHHLPQARYLEYMQTISRAGKASGLLPDIENFAGLLGNLNITPESHVIACDNEGNTRASRFLWTMIAFGHSRVSLLNGGSNGWLYSGFPTESGFSRGVKLTPYPGLELDTSVIATKTEILEKLDDPNTLIIDTRSSAEYQGHDSRGADFGGHIPGAIHLDWISAINIANNKRINNEQMLGDIYAPLGIKPDREIIVYCHTHLRSAHTFMVLKSLGYPNVKGYAGGWSDWGNDRSTPKEK